MFVTKKRFIAETTYLLGDLRAAERRADKNAGTIVDLAREVAELKAALRYIAEQRTSAANATVTRMADAADEALGVVKVEAEFISEEPRPVGTLAQIRDALRSKTATATDGRVFVNDSVVFIPTVASYGDASDALVPAEYNSPAYTGYDGGSSGGGGASSSYDYGSSCGGDSGGGGGCD